MVEEAVGAAQDLARAMANVKIELDKSNIKHTSPSFWGDLDSVTLNSKESIKISLGGSKITIDSSGLTAKLTKLSEDLQQLEIKATQITENGTMKKLSADSMQVDSKMLQLP